MPAPIAVAACTASRVLRDGRNEQVEGRRDELGAERQQPEQLAEELDGRGNLCELAPAAPLDVHVLLDQLDAGARVDGAGADLREDPPRGLPPRPGGALGIERDGGIDENRRHPGYRLVQ